MLGLGLCLPAFKQVFGGGAGGGDEFFDDVVLLLHGNGTDGQTSTVDSSSFARTVTRVGSAQLQTAAAKFGTAALSPLSNNSWWSVASSTDFDLGGVDFTIEAWLRPATLGLNGWIGRANNPNDTANASWGCSLSTNQIAFDYWTTVGVTSVRRTVSTTVALGTYYHVAISRSGSTAKIFLNGVQQGADQSVPVFPDSTGPVMIGAIGNTPTNRYFEGGAADEVRITKGVARYTSAFTPPTAAFPDK